MSDSQPAQLTDAQLDPESWAEVRTLRAAYRSVATGEVFVSAGPGEGHVRFAARLGISEMALKRMPSGVGRGTTGPWSIPGYEYGLVDRSGLFHTIPELDAKFRARSVDRVAGDGRTEEDRERWTSAFRIAEEVRQEGGEPEKRLSGRCEADGISRAACVYYRGYPRKWYYPAAKTNP